MIAAFLGKIVGIFVLRTEPAPDVSREIEALKARASETSKANGEAAEKMKEIAFRNVMASENLGNDIRKSVGDVVASMARGPKT